MTSKLLQLLDTVFDPTQPKWKELEFDYDNEITIKLFSKNRVTNNKVFQFKVDESSDTSESSKSISLLILRCRRENNASKLFINSSDSKIKLISDFISLHGNGSSILIDLKTHEHSDINLISNKNENTSTDPTRPSSYIKYPLAPTKTVPYAPTNTKPFTVIPNRYRPILPASSPSKNLPRLLCRNRSFNDASTTANTKGLSSGGSSESGQNLNQTGILFKKVEILFEKIKSSPTLDQTTANLLSKMISFSSPKHTKISQKLLEFRPKKLVNNSLLFKDEQNYFKNTKKMSYDFYDPYSDKSLILDLYNKQNYTRDFVDTVCTVVNNMVNVVSIANNDKIVNNNTKTISTESFSKPNKTITILPKPSNMATSNTQVLNNILSKPSVIIINNNNNTNNNQNINTTISPGSIPTSSSKILADFNKKIQNPFIAAIKSNLNNNIQQQIPQSESHPKTIVKRNNNS